MSEKVGYAPTRPCIQPANLNIGLAMTDRELLEAAAKSINLKLRYNYWGDRSANQPWDPLEDDGDALRLAVELRLHILHNDPGEPVLWVSAVLNKRGIHGVVEFQDEEQRDAATRRAIVRAAAKIGEATKGGEA